MTTTKNVAGAMTKIVVDVTTKNVVDVMTKKFNTLMPLELRHNENGLKQNRIEIERSRKERVMLI